MQLSYSQKVIFNAASIRNFEFANFWFLVVSVSCDKICVCILICCAIWTIYGWDMEIQWFSKRRSSAMLDFRNWTFSSPKFRVRPIMPPYSKFRLNRTIWSRLIAKKWFSIWRPSAVLNLWISEIFSHFRRLGQNLRRHTKFRHIRTIRDWDMEITIFKNVGFIVTASYCTGRLRLTLLTLC